MYSNTPSFTFPFLATIKNIFLLYIFSYRPIAISCPVGSDIETFARSSSTGNLQYLSTGWSEIQLVTFDNTI